MAIEVNTGFRHRCQDCGKKWWEKSLWSSCNEASHEHECKPDEPEPEKVECGFAQHKFFAALGDRFCARCGVRLEE